MQWYYIAFFVASLLYRALAPKPKLDRGDPEPPEIPSITEGTILPVVFGRVLIKTPFVIWWGDGVATTSNYTTKYYLGVHFGLCQGGIEKAITIRSQNKTLWSGNAYDQETKKIDAVDFYGGENRGGGVYGYIKMLFGSQFQNVDSYLESKIGAGDVPAYRGISSAIWYGPSKTEEYEQAPLGSFVLESYVTTEDPDDKITIYHSYSYNFTAGDVIWFQQQITDKFLTVTQIYNDSLPYYIIAATPNGEEVDSYIGSISAGQTVYYFSSPPGTAGRIGYMGTSSYIPEWAFEVERQPRKAAYGFDNTDGDANPVDIIHDLITNKDYGLGFEESIIDLNNFQTVALQLSGENFFISVLWDKDETTGDLIIEILRHIDAALYSDPQTGLFKIKLARDDYDVNSLETLDESNIINLDKFSRMDYAETKNQIRIKYTNRDKEYEQGTITVHNMANIEIQGRTSSEDIEYPYIHNKTLATKIASRDLRYISHPIATLEITVSAEFIHLRPGDVFKWQWPKLNINNMVMRIIKIDINELHDGTIKLECLEDIFKLGEQIIDPPTY